MNRLIAIITVSLLLMFGAANALKSRGFGAPGVPVASDSADAPTPATHHEIARADDGGALMIHRDGSGQFHLKAAVNGSDATFLIDTGADVVALGEAEAERLGVHYDRANFQPMMKTASGTGNGTHVTIDQLSIGDSEFRDVDAVVVQGLETNLLGQSVLRKFGKLELEGDKMVIRQN